MPAADKTTPGTDVAAIDGAMSQTLAHALRGGEIEDQDSKQIAAGIAERILHADTLEDIFKAGGTVAAVELVGVTLTVRDLALRRSQIEGTTAYLLIDAVRHDTGELIIVNTSAPRVMAQLARAKDIGAIDLNTGKTLAVEVVTVGNPPGPGQSPPIGLKLAA